MKPGEEAQASAQEWLTLAEADLRTATVLLGRPGLSHNVCLHAQQAAEKALKAYLAWLAEADIPRTHDLQLLASLIPERGGAEPPQDGLADLAAYAVTSRYPPLDEPSQAEATRASALARDIVT